MAKTEVFMCDDCKTTLSVQKCDNCSCDLCPQCIKKYRFKLNNEIELIIIELCKDCYKKYEKAGILQIRTYSAQFKDEFKDKLLSYLKKTFVLDSLK